MNAGKMKKQQFLLKINMKYHPITETIKNLLNNDSYWYKTFEHEPVRTSEEAAKIRPGYTLKQGAKAIIVRVKESASSKYMVMLVMPADKRFDTNKVKKLFNAKDIRFATEKEVGLLTGGIKPGGVPPFGNLFDMKVIADPSFFKNEKIIFNAGDRRFSIAMRSEDYKKLVGPEIINII